MDDGVACGPKQGEELILCHGSILDLFSGMRDGADMAGFLDTVCNKLRQNVFLLGNDLVEVDSEQLVLNAARQQVVREASIAVPSGSG
jgi:hypothetical protein